MITLFPDQAQSEQAVIDAMRGGCRSVLLQGSTGSGKSVIAASFLARATKKDKTSMFIVPRRDLVHQMHKHFLDFRIPHSYIAAGYQQDPFGQNYICSSDTLKLRLDKLRAPNLAIIDETHYGGEGLDRIIKWLKANGTWIIGLSATPWKSSGQGLGCWYDQMICGPSIKWLIENKRLAQYRYFAPSKPDMTGVPMQGGDYVKSGAEERMKYIVGDAIKHYKTHAMGKLGVSFFVSRKASEEAAQKYRDAGVSAVHIDGETPMEERSRIFKAYARREITQLCNAELLTFGFDIAAASGDKTVTVQCITDCQPTQSLAKQMQKLGRGLRYDVEPHLFFDHAGNVDLHGFPNDEREWTLSDREKQKRGEQEKTFQLRVCPKCYYAESVKPVCSECGHIHEVNSRMIEEVEGDLAEISERAEKKEARIAQGRAQTEDELTRMFIAQGSTAWNARKRAGYVLKAREAKKHG